jgi:hypothetical protein
VLAALLGVRNWRTRAVYWIESCKNFIPLSRLTHLTLRILEAPDTETAMVAEEALVDYLVDAGNTQEQIDYWLGYSSNMSAVEGETLAEVIETEAILAAMQGQISTG